MSQRVFNFSAGPAVLPTSVLEEAREEMLSFRGSGMSLMEISHRSEAFAGVLEDARSGLKALLDVPDDYSILFLQGGASLQFSMVPLNFLKRGETADYIITGSWGKRAFQEAGKCGYVRAAFSGESEGFRGVPEPGMLELSADAKYVHYTSNETIEGVEFPYELDGRGLPVVCDASSNILSKPAEIGNYALIYAGAQKNIGPSGVTVVIIREDMVEQIPAGQHSMLDYRVFARNKSMPNTPNTWGIYLISLVCKWLRQQGGLSEMAARNRRKAWRLYKAIDSSDGFYTGHAEREARSLMNVTFRLPTAVLDDAFCAEADDRGLIGLRGHRSVGGIRASIYNAFPEEGVAALIEHMQDFARRKA